MPIMPVTEVYVISFQGGYWHLMTVTPEINGTSLNLGSLDHISLSFKKFLRMLYDTRAYPVLCMFFNTVLLVLTSTSECCRMWIFKAVLNITEINPHSLHIFFCRTLSRIVLLEFVFLGNLVCRLRGLNCLIESEIIWKQGASLCFLRGTVSFLHHFPA